MAKSKDVITHIKKATRRLLILAYFSSRCGCTVARLEKKEYVEDPQGGPRRINGKFELGALYHGPAEFGRCAARI